MMFVVEHEVPSEDFLGVYLDMIAGDKDFKVATEESEFEVHYTAYGDSVVNIFGHDVDICWTHKDSTYLLAESKDHAQRIVHKDLMLDSGIEVTHVEIDLINEV